jgi:hypothetical protein
MTVVMRSAMARSAHTGHSEDKNMLLRQPPFISKNPISDDPKYCSINGSTNNGYESRALYGWLL